MARIAMMMLFGAGGRYVALVFGLAFAVLLSTQQVSIFLGVLERGTGPLQNIGAADVWVTSERTLFVDMNRGMSDSELWRLRSLPGVAWVEPMLSFQTIAETQDGGFYQAQLMGIDHSALVGRPPEVLKGDLADLRRPDTVFAEVSGLKNLPLKMGDIVRVNDRHATVVGFCRARSGILSRPQLFATNENVMRMMPPRRRLVTFALLRVQSGVAPEQVCQQVRRSMPNLTAFTADELRMRSWSFVMWRTSIGLNFAVTVGLGLAVGLIVSIAAFNSIHRRPSAVFRAAEGCGGRGPRTLVGMILLQAGVAGLISYGIGIGLAGLMTMHGLAPDAELSSLFPWQLMAGGALPMLLCIGVASILSILRVIRVDPVMLFQ